VNSRVLAAVGVAIVGLVIGTAFVFADGDSPAPDAAVQPPVENASDTAAPATVPPLELPNRGPHPELLEIDGWLQSDVTSLQELRGKVVAVQFWTFACRNCQATIPHMQELYEKYGPEGFEIVGIHAPEFGFEAEVPNIEEAATELGVSWPIVLDTNKRTFHSWQEGPTAHWPRIYLLDRDGNIRYDHIGEGRYAETDAAVQSLLAEPT
jgi:thiol-disulfide isomerase/thioredoxin